MYFVIYPIKSTLTNFFRHVYKGKVYVLHIKHSSDRDWESDNLVYAIANDGGKGFSYSDFKRACFLNKRFFLAKKNQGKMRKTVIGRI